MAQTTLGTQVTTGNQKQMKEDIADIVFNVSPTKTPFQSLCKRGKCINVTVGWQEDLLVNPDAPAAVAEGAAAPAATGISTAMVNNYTQIYTETASVSGTADKVSWYGRKKEMAYQMAKKTAQMKNSLERTLINFCNNATGTAMVTDGTAASPILIDPRADRVWAQNSPRAMKNFMYLEAFSMLGDGTAGQSQDRTLYTGLGAAISEQMVTNAHEKIWALGGDPSVLMVNGKTSVAISGFALDGAGTSGRFRDSGQGKKLVNVVDLYISPFGELSVVINRFFPTIVHVAAQQALFIDPEQLELDYLRGPYQQVLANTGDFESRQLLMECTLKVLNSDGCGALVNFTS